MKRFFAKTNGKAARLECYEGTYLAVRYQKAIIEVLIYAATESAG